MISSCAPKKALFNSLTKKFLKTKKSVSSFFFSPPFFSGKLFSQKNDKNQGSSFRIPVSTPTQGTPPTHPLRRLEAQQDRDLRGRVLGVPKAERIFFPDLAGREKLKNYSK